MAESYLELTSGDVCDLIETYTGDATAGKALRHVRAGYRRVLAGNDPRLAHIPGAAAHVWSFLEPLGQIAIGGAQTETANGTLASQIITASGAVFNRSMVGLTITITGATDASVEITGYTSTTVVTVATLTADFAAKAISVSSTGIYDLPADFGGLVEPFTYPYHASEGVPDCIEVVPEKIFEIWRDENALGDAYCWAIVESDGTGAKQLLVAPNPDQARVWLYRYRTLATDIDDDSGNFLGGPSFVEAIKAAAFEDAEAITGRTSGVWADRAAVEMARAIDMDKRFFKTHEVQNMAKVDIGM